MTTIKDSEVLLGRGDIDIELKTERKRKKSKSTTESIQTKEKRKNACGTITKVIVFNWSLFFLYLQTTYQVEGDIGSMFDEDMAIKHLVRFLAVKFLLSGHKGELLIDSKTSAKILALNCIGNIFNLQPNLVLLPLFKNESDNSEAQCLSDVFLLHSHSDPQVASTAALAAGQFLSASIVINEGKHLFTQKHLSAESILRMLCQVRFHA